MSHLLVYFWKKARNDVLFPFRNCQYTLRVDYLMNAHKRTWPSSLKVVTQELRDLYAG
jgi:hypothetical protein